MKLSINTIYDFINIPIKSRHINTVDDSLNLPRPIFLEDKTFLDYGTLYICESEKLPENPEIIKGSVLISLGEPGEKYINEKLDLIVIEDTVDIFHLSNHIHLIFDFFEKWDFELKDSLSKANPLQHLVDCSEKIFGNGISVMDSEYHIIAQSELNMAAPEYEELDNTGNLPTEIVNAFKNDEKYRNISNEKNIFIYPNEILPYKCLCKNIFLKNEFLFRIIVSDTDSTFKNCDATLLKHLSKYADMIAENMHNIHQEENTILTSCFQNMISEKDYSKMNFEKNIKKTGWDLNDTYRLIFIQPSSHDIFTATTFYFRNRLMREFKETYTFIHDENILVIVNIDKMNSSSSDYIPELNNFIREANFRAGISNFFQGFNNFREYYIQSKIALEIGSLQSPTLWTHKFSDNVFPYILNKITEDLPANFLYSPIIERLQRHDQLNQTSYVKTLQQYLNNNMNTLKTAKDLFIHRATMIYRIERIKEIGKTDLVDKDEVLHLFLTLRMIQE